jgi:hypothetical protein
VIPLTAVADRSAQQGPAGGRQFEDRVGTLPFLDRLLSQEAGADQIRTAVAGLGFIAGIQGKGTGGNAQGVHKAVGFIVVGLEQGSVAFEISVADAGTVIPIKNGAKHGAQDQHGQRLAHE